MRWMPLAIGLLTAIALFVVQQFYFEVQDARADARGDAESILAFAHLAREQQPAQLKARLAQVVRGFEHVAQARHCDAHGCLALAGGSDTTAANAWSDDWNWKSFAVKATSSDDPAESVQIRYSLLQAHANTLRDLGFFALILAVASAAGWFGTRRLRTRMSDAEAQVRHAATYDALTGLPNRSSFEASASRLIRRAEVEKERAVLLFLDLDGFKEINDRFGHHVGDRMLSITADRIRSAIDEHDLIGRLGGDEFGIVTGWGTGVRYVNAKAKDLMRLLAEPVTIDGHTLALSVSVGASTIGNDVQTFDEARRRADVALYEVKRTARGGLLHFATEMDLGARSRYELVSELRTAIDQDQLFLEYQPQVDGHGELRGVEALVRWRHPTRGLVRPDQFISVAESAGLIVALGLKVVEIACTDLVRARNASIQLPYISVNVSPKQLSDPKLVSSLMAALGRHGLTPRDLELEVTESSLMESQGADEAIQQLARLGFRVAIDDFGTGYSSLSRLHSMPVHKLKIDRSFVMQLPDGTNGAAIAESILSLARKLNLKTVAEGVETSAQADWLRDAGCQLMQGYLFARPMPFVQLLEWSSFAQKHTATGQPTWAETAPFAEI